MEGEKTGRKIANETIQVTGIFKFQDSESELSIGLIQVGPLPTRMSKWGNQYISVAIDSFSRYVFVSTL